MLGTSTARGRWTALEKLEHINVLELKAAYFSLQSLCPGIQNKHIQLKLDNTTAVTYINNMGGSKSMNCNRISSLIWAWAVTHKLWLSACHLPGSSNREADAQSRMIDVQNEWKLSPTIFNKLCKRWGKPEIDLFASRITHQLDLYVSWRPDPGAHQIDAFSFVWHSYFYAFPPFSLIDRCLQKIQQDKAHGILVAPRWATRPWWAMLMQLAQETIEIKHAARLLINPCTGAQHPLKHLTLVACRI